MASVWERDQSVLAKLEKFTLEFVQQLALSDGSITVAHVRRQFIAALAHDLIRNKRTVTKRDVYYSTKLLFKDVPSVDRALKSLCTALGIDVLELNIVAAPKSFVSGNLFFTTYDGHDVNVAIYGPQGILCPARPDRLTNVHTQTKAILILEKETAYDCVVLDKDFQNRYKDDILVVTGKGFPDAAIRRLLKTLCCEKRIPAYIITDGDPHGALIAMCYMREIHNTGSIHWIGCYHSQIGTLFDVHRNGRLALTNLERKVAENQRTKLNESEETQFQYVKKELENMLEANWKFEIEAAQNIGGTQGAGATGDCSGNRNSFANFVLRHCIPQILTRSRNSQ